MSQERTKLVGVAIRYRGKVYSLLAPNRHSDVIIQILKHNPDVCVVCDEEQGFIDEAGTFLNRHQALVSAQLFHQIKEGAVIRYDQLSSDNVW